MTEELRALDAKRSDAIDYTDAAEVTDWSGAVRGRFRPHKRPVSLMLDAAVLDYFERDGAGGREEKIDLVLRDWIRRQRSAA